MYLRYTWGNMNPKIVSFQLCSSSSCWQYTYVVYGQRHARYLGGNWTSCVYPTKLENYKMLLRSGIFNRFGYIGTIAKINKGPRIDPPHLTQCNFVNSSVSTAKGSGSAQLLDHPHFIRATDQPRSYVVSNMDSVQSMSTARVSKRVSAPSLTAHSTHNSSFQRRVLVRLLIKHCGVSQLVMNEMMSYVMQTVNWLKHACSSAKPFRVFRDSFSTLYPPFKAQSLKL